MVFESGVLHEFVVALADNGAERHIPVVLLAEEDDDRIRALREFDWGSCCGRDDRKQA